MYDPTFNVTFVEDSDGKAIWVAFSSDVFELFVFVADKLNVSDKVPLFVTLIVYVAFVIVSTDWFAG